MPGEEPSPGGDKPTKRPNYGSPSWTPYRSPGAGRGGVLRLLRRYAFSITLVVSVLAVGALIYFSPTHLSPNQDAGRTASSSSQSTISVYSEPAGASVIVGADTVGETPLENRRVPAGTHLVSVTKEGYLNRDTVLTLAADQSTVYAPRLGQAEVLSDEQREAQGPPTTEDFRPAPSSDQTEDEGSNQESYAGSPPETRQAQASTQEQEPNREQELTQQQAANSDPSGESETGSLVTGSLELRSNPERATVELNGYRVGSTPVTLDQVAAGTHELTFIRSGYETVTKRIAVQGNDTVTVEASLEAQTGYLRVLARPWGSIYINGERRVENSDVWYETRLQAGTYTVTVRHPVLGEAERAVEVAASDTQSVAIDLREN